MMMMGLHFMKDVPFRHVYIHALVRDAQGQKMSKSKGNVIDPLLMMDKFGTDAFRFTLTAFAAMGRDIKMSEERIEGYRHFINKIWNAARFALMHLTEEEKIEFEPAKISESGGLTHQWILHRLEEVKEEVRKALEAYRFNDAAGVLYQFVWHEFCDWYLEMIKPELYGQDEEVKSLARGCLKQVLSEILVLLHPIIPFVTQEVWSYIPGQENPNLAREPFPESRPECLQPDVVERMEFLQQVVVSVRNIRSELGIGPSQKLKLYVRVEGEDRDFLLGQKSLIMHLARLESMQAEPDLTPPPGAASNVVKGHELYVPVKDLVDIESELARLDKELKKINKELEFVSRKLSNEGFVNKAPAHVVDKEKRKLNEFEEKKVKLEKLRDRLAGLK